MKRLTLGLAAMVLACSGALQAHDFSVGKLKIEHPWSRATAPGAKVAGAFMQIQNAGDADELLSAQSEVAGKVELHEMKMVDGVMQMKAIKAVALPAAAEVKLAPGGLHVMLIDLKRPLKQGETFPMVLTFAKAGTVKVDVQVEAMGAKEGHTGH